MKNYIARWDFKRVAQLTVGLFLIWNYIEDKMLFSLLFGLMMSIQAIMNIGCFSTKGCGISPQNTNTTDTIDFEEIE